MIQYFSFIQWGALQYFWYAPLLFLAIAIAFYGVYKKIRARKQLTVRKNNMLKGASSVRLGIKVILWLMGALLLYAALLHPRWNKKEEVVAQEGRDIFIALDVSRSMLAQDNAPNRLEFAKSKIKALLKQLACERVGLILFSGATTVQCPLTADYSAFFMFLDQVDAETISSGTTAIDKAIEKAIQAFKKMQDRQHKIVVLITDGEDFSRNLSAIQKEAQANNLNIFTLGVGTAEGAPIPILDDKGNKKGYLHDEHGNVVITRLNEPLLQAVAQETGGTYIHATPDAQDVTLLKKYVEQFEKEKTEDKKLSTLQEQYPYFVGAALICFAIEWML